VVEQRLGIVRLDLERLHQISQALRHAAGLRPHHAQKMTGVEIARIIRQHLQIQAFGLRQASAAVQRDRLFVQGFSVHISRIRRAWYPFDIHQKQWVAKGWG
jgi:ABC-type phosphate transport system auxiliary subunit